MARHDRDLSLNMLVSNGLLDLGLSKPKRSDGNMLVAIYVTMEFSCCGLRGTGAGAALIDFVIVSGAVHASVMAIECGPDIGLSQHLAFRGDVMGTYIADHACVTASATILFVRVASTGMSESAAKILLRSVLAWAALASLIAARHEASIGYASQQESG